MRWTNVVLLEGLDWLVVVLIKLVNDRNFGVGYWEIKSCLYSYIAATVILYE